MNEIDFIERLLRPLVSDPGADGLSDDVALLATSKNPQIITTDTLVEGRHFRVGDPWFSVGRKLVRVNVSDCFAKGAAPRHCLFNLTWNPDYPEEDLRALISGIAEDLRVYNIRLIGGDTTSNVGPVVLTLTLTGETFDLHGPVRRTGAQPGHDVWVTGTIGDACLGLEFPDAQDEPGASLNARYLVPELVHPEFAEVIARYALSAMDVSDGLISDAGHIAAASAVQLILKVEQVPLSDESRAVLQADGSPFAIRNLLTGGDDYQVLFTTPEDHREALLIDARHLNQKITRIGTVEAGRGVTCLLQGEDVSETLTGGWKHKLSS